MKAVTLLGALAAAFWFSMFSPWTAGLVNFWAVMLAATALLAGSALALDRGRLRDLYAFRPVHLLIGVCSAVVLYVVFYAGDLVASRLFDFARPEVGRIYGTREQAPALFIALALLLWIGPAEEVFWRGFVQNRLSERFGTVWGWLAASLAYTLVHVWSFNPMLLVAAAVCGLFWGAVFARCKSVWPGLVSHALWDVTIFVMLPIQ